MHHKKSHFILCMILSIVPYTLFAWDDGEKLNDNSCKFEKETGYKGASFYIKDNEGFLIVDGGDPRYGTISTVYNARTCKKVTSGDPVKSDFSGLMKRRGFIKTDIKSNRAVDRSFQHKITFLENSDEIIVSIEPVPASVAQELNRLVASISDKSASSYISVSKPAQEFLGYASFYSLVLEKIDNLSSTDINYDYVSSLLDKLRTANINTDSARHIVLAKQEEIREITRLKRAEAQRQQQILAQKKKEEAERLFPELFIVEKVNASRGKSEVFTLSGGITTLSNFSDLSVSTQNVNFTFRLRPKNVSDLKYEKYDVKVEIIYSYVQKPDTKNKFVSFLEMLRQKYRMIGGRYYGTFHLTRKNHYTDTINVNVEINPSVQVGALGAHVKLKNTDMKIEIFPLEISYE